MWNCPICNSKVGYVESFTEENPEYGGFPTTIYDYRCRQGHLIQAISPGKVWQVYTLNEDGDELWVLVFNTDWVLIEIVDWQKGFINCNLEGGNYV